MIDQSSRYAVVDSSKVNKWGAMLVMKEIRGLGLVG